MSRLPELERELVTVAARLGSPRRRLIRTARVAAPAVALTVTVIAVMALFIERDDGAPSAPAHRPEPPPAPKRGVKPLAGTVSKPFEFTARGTRYTAIGFRTSQRSICAALTDADKGALAGTSCLGTRLLPDVLESRPAHVFAGGGAVQTGFARANVTELGPAGKGSKATVVLSKPWRPWNGEPIRFFFVFNPHAGRPQPGVTLRTYLRAHLSDGSTVEIP